MLSLVSVAKVSGDEKRLSPKKGRIAAPVLTILSVRRGWSDQPQRAGRRRRSGPPHLLMRDGDNFSMREVVCLAYLLRTRRRIEGLYMDWHRPLLRVARHEGHLEPLHEVPRVFWRSP